MLGAILPAERSQAPGHQDGRQHSMPAASKHSVDSVPQSSGEPRPPPFHSVPHRSVNNTHPCLPYHQQRPSFRRDSARQHPSTNHNHHINQQPVASKSHPGNPPEHSNKDTQDTPERPRPSLASPQPTPKIATRLNQPLLISHARSAPSPSDAGNTRPDSQTRAPQRHSPSHHDIGTPRSPLLLPPIPIPAVVPGS